MNQEELLNKILVAVVDTQESLRELREEVVTKDVLQEVKSEIVSHIDGFIKLHEAVMLELTAMRSNQKRLEERIQKIELKLGMATA